MLFDFDAQDMSQREDYVKDAIGCGIVFLFVTAVDLRVLNSIKSVRHVGPHRKFVLLNVLNLPFYFYFYHQLTTHNQRLRKSLVKKYLLAGDEILFKR